MKKNELVKAVIAVLIAVLIVIGVLAVMSIFSGCGNKQFFDTTYTFDKAIIYLQDGTTVEGEVESWDDYDSSDQIQVKIDGKVYLVHSTNITLIAE